MSIHDGHRQRKREQFREHGLVTFADHEVLELLLFYAMPRQDTNPIAHRLLERFGSLDGVFSAPFAELQKVEDIGESAATLIRMILPLCRRIYADGNKHPIILNTDERVGSYFLDLFFGEKRERLYQACLDSKGKLLAQFMLAEGGVDRVNLNMRTIAENALRVNACSVVLAHNHPSGVALPSDEDKETTLEIWRVLGSIGVELVDHLIVADGDYVSLRDNGLFELEEEHGI